MSYSPVVGRWLEPDPEKYVDGLNLYLYVGANPTNRLDPLGLSELSASQTLPRSGRFDLEKLKSICGSFFSNYDIKMQADRSEMESQLKKAGRGDVWLYLGHGLADSTGKVVALEEHDSLIPYLYLLPTGLYPLLSLGDGPGNDPVYARELANAATDGGKKQGPGLVILGGCKGADLADTFIQSGSRCVISSKTTIDAGVSAQMFELLLQKLCGENKTIQQAVRETQQELVVGGRRDVELDVRFRDAKDKQKRLSELLK